MAIFDGKELTFEQSDWLIVNFFRMLWRYGLSFLRMQMWVESVLDKFMRLEVTKKARVLFIKFPNTRYPCPGMTLGCCY